MQELAESIAEIIKDYHNYDDFHFTEGHILSWVRQFEEEDQEFILQEFLHLLKTGIYVSETKARHLLIQALEKLSEIYKFPNLASFLENATFLDLQREGKSQYILLRIIDDEIKKAGHPGIKYCGSKSNKFVLYIDDILATGGTLFNDLLPWLQEKDSNEESNLDKVINKSQVLLAVYLCIHSWANEKVQWRLKIALTADGILNKINFYSFYKIENHPKRHNQKFNFAYPLSEQPKIVKDYLAQLQAVHNEEYAFRKANLPIKEDFYSSPINRIRFENILLLKGIELLSQAKELQKNHRPLGATMPSFKLFGTGTLFFTWRNISNTSPIVFWWKSASWEPLFPLYRRGSK